MGNSTPCVEHPAFMSQAEFSRFRQVSRKTVAVWKSRQLLTFSALGLVDVALSEARLDQRPAVFRGDRATQRPLAVTPDAAPTEVTETAATQGNG